MLHQVRDCRPVIPLAGPQIGPQRQGAAIAALPPQFLGSRPINPLCERPFAWQVLRVRMAQPRSRSDCKPFTPIRIRPLCNRVVREFGDFDGQRARTEPRIESSHVNGGLRITGEIEMALPGSFAVSTLPQVGGHDEVFWGWRLVLHGGVFGYPRFYRPPRASTGFSQKRRK